MTDIDIASGLGDHRRRQVTELHTVEAGFVLRRPDGRPLRSDAANDALDRCIRRTGVERFTVHFMRHFALSALLDQGVPIAEVARVAGHADPTITLKIYAHALGDGTAAADAIGAVLEI